MKSRKLLGVTALFYTDKKCKREWDRLSGLTLIITHPRLHFFGDSNSSIYGRSFPWLSPCSHGRMCLAGFHCQNQPIDLSRSILLPADSIH
eukprot:COSAG01_NODE_6887_length_3453_cov_94.174873_3_plen_91_part_00